MRVHLYNSGSCAEAWACRGRTTERHQCVIFRYDEDQPSVPNELIAVLQLSASVRAPSFLQMQQ